MPKNVESERIHCCTHILITQIEFKLELKLYTLFFLSVNPDPYVSKIEPSDWLIRGFDHMIRTAPNFRVILH